ncbi:MAG: SufD family Fe-S cluster assembly protein [Candidatus Nealsonbacteria bacterium]|nr:SufD family Fe-S cluster assembly protein [Candidatus Nealsonbacteria bacterium]
MKGAKNANRAYEKSSAPVNFLQIDHRVENISQPKGTIILPSSKAWENFPWVKSLFKIKPKEGYFIWVKEQGDMPLSTCLTISSPKTVQNLTNILVVEKNIKAKANVLCNSIKNNLCGTHKAKGKLILREGASLEYSHIHKWGEKDFVNPDYEFFLEKDAKLVYNYQNLLPPEKLDLITSVHSKENSSVQMNFVINGVNSKINLKEKIFLEGDNAQGIMKLRLVGKKNSQIKAESSVVALAAGKGHLDCQGLLVDEKSTIFLSPEIICKNRLAQITHEASLGKISEEELNYLRMRGLKESEAIDLIVSGFLQA